MDITSLYKWAVWTILASSKSVTCLIILKSTITMRNNLTKFEKFTELTQRWTIKEDLNWTCVLFLMNSFRMYFFNLIVPVSVTQCLWHLSREVLCYSITGDRETRRSRLEHGYNKKDLIILQLLMSIIYIMAHEAYKVDIISIQV